MVFIHNYNSFLGIITSLPYSSRFKSYRSLSIQFRPRLLYLLLSSIPKLSCDAEGRRRGQLIKRSSCVFFVTMKCKLEVAYRFSILAVFFCSFNRLALALLFLEYVSQNVFHLTRLFHFAEKWNIAKTGFV